MALAQDKPKIIDVWPDKAPGETGAIGPEEDVVAKPDQRKIRRGLTHLFSIAFQLF